MDQRGWLEAGQLGSGASEKRAEQACRPHAWEELSEVKRELPQAPLTPLSLRSE